jgi:hypothetical protein
MEAIVVNLGGVIVPQLSQTVISTVEELSESAVEYSQRQLIRSCVRDTQLGHSDLSQLMEQSGLRTIGIADYWDLTPREIKVNHAVTGILRKLASSREVYILGDYPPLWLPILDQDPEWVSLSTLIQWLDLAAGGLATLIPGVIDFVLTKTDCRKENVLLIDARSELTSACVKAELNAILFVNGFRLEQELQLRKFFG